MLNICDLPGKLLSDVAEYLEYDRLALHSLTLVSRRWRPIAERLLYRHIEPLTGRSRNWVTGQTCYFLLHRSFDESPRLWRHVRSCNASAKPASDRQQILLRGMEDGKNALTDLDINDVQPHKDYWSEPTHQLNADLSRYPSLRELYIGYPIRTKPVDYHELTLTIGTLTPAFYPAITHKITSMTWLRLLSFVEMLVFMKLPNIHTIAVKEFYAERSDIENDENASKSRLRRLIFDSPVSETIVHRLLRYCASLEELRWTPLLEDTSELPLRWTPTMATTQRTLDALEIVQDTLKVL
jgi:hypothetical protein